MEALTVFFIELWSELLLKLKTQETPCGIFRNELV